MQWFQKVDNLVKSTNPWASWIWRLAPMLIGGVVSAWITHLHNAPFWDAVAIVATVANSILMLGFWFSIGVTYVKYTKLLSRENETDKQRKRKLIDEWRALLFDVTTLAQLYETVGQNLRVRPEFMTLKGYLPAEVIQSLDGLSTKNTYPGLLQSDVTIRAVEMIIFNLERDWLLI